VRGLSVARHSTGAAKASTNAARFDEWRDYFDRGRRGL